MKKSLMSLALLALPLVAYSAEGPYLFDFIKGQETGKAYRTLIAKHHLPQWVQNGGTSTPANEVTYKGKTYLALSGCKPHNCPAESIAVLYSPDNGEIYGVYSEHDLKRDSQKLTWLNLDPTDVDGRRNLLFTRLNGDVTDPQ